MEQGPRDASFEEFFDSTFPLAQHIAYRIVGNVCAAEDLAAEAFVRTYVRWGRLREDPCRIGWVLRVTGNLAIDHVRRKPPPVEAAAPVDIENNAVLRVALAAALRALPARQRGVLVLRYLADLSEEEVARQLGISQGSVKTHAHRAIHRLRRTFPEEVSFALE